MAPRYKLFVVSDTHRGVAALEGLLPVVNECDYFVHLGDLAGDLGALRERIKAQIVSVRGNCDFGPSAPDEIVLPVGDSKFFITHGHRYGVKQDPLRLALRAAESGCRYALYGHTHTASVRTLCGVELINPGSLTAPRVGRPSYAIVAGDGDTFFAKIISI